MNPSKNTLEKIVKKKPPLIFFSYTPLIWESLQWAGGGQGWPHWPPGERLPHKFYNNSGFAFLLSTRMFCAQFLFSKILSYSWLCFWVSPNILAFPGYCVRMLGGDQTHLQISKAVLMIYNEPIMETLMREVFPSIWSCHLLVLTSDLIWAVFAACLSLLLWITGKQNLKISRIWHPRCCADITCMTIFDKGKHE